MAQNHAVRQLCRASVVFCAVTALTLILRSVLLCAQSPGSDPSVAPPVAPVRAVTDQYFGVAVADPYRYMEDLKDPQVAAWFQGQGNYTHVVLESIPGRAALLERIKMYDESAPSFVSSVRLLPSGRYFYEKRLASEDVPKLYLRDGLGGQEQLIVDPATYAQGGGHWSINYYEPSLDGKYVAVGVSGGGSEDATIHVFDLEKRQELGETIDRARFGGVVWRLDGHSFYYNRLQKLGPNDSSTERETKSRVYLHELGRTADQDPAVLGYEVSPAVVLKPADIPIAIALPNVSTHVFGMILHGTTNEITVYAAPYAGATGPKAGWSKLFDVDQDVVGFAVHGDDIYLQSHKGASRYQILHTKLSAPDVAHADVVLAASEAVVRDFGTAKDALYVQELDGGISRLIRIPYGGKPQQITLPVNGSVALTRLDVRAPGTVFKLGSWTQAPKIYSYDPASNRVTDTGLQPSGRFDNPPDLQSIETKVKSYDGTMVPLSIVYRKGTKLDGSAPTILKAYGAYGINEDPSFDPRNLAWFEQNGIIAVAHVRGGGEYGEDWHLAGKGPTKPNTWKDFIACAEYLIANKYSASSKLAIYGGSAGGITVGRSITERPDLFAVALDLVPVSDALRFELSPNGPPNIAEFGTVKTEEGFKGLYEMSPYEHVKQDTAYPATMITTGFNDGRVASWEPGKLAARLQAATASGKPILLRVDYDAGHQGVGSTKTQVEIEMADEMSFALWQFGESAFQPIAKSDSR